MNAKQFDALVNKGAITQVGIVEDAEKLDAQDFTDLHMTQHEAVAEVLANASDETLEEIQAEPVTEEMPEEIPVVEPEPIVEETVVEETPVEETPVEETPVEETPVEETPVEETPVEETPVEETPAPAAKKSKKAKNVAPSVDPVE